MPSSLALEMQMRANPECSGGAGTRNVRTMNEERATKVKNENDSAFLLPKDQDIKPYPTAAVA